MSGLGVGPVTVPGRRPPVHTLTSGLGFSCAFSFWGPLLARGQASWRNLEPPLVFTPPPDSSPLCSPPGGLLGFIFHSRYVSLFVSKLLPKGPSHPRGSGPLDAAGLSCSSEVSCSPPPGSAAVYPAAGSPLTWSHDTTGGNLCGVCHFSSGLCLRTCPSGSPMSLVAQQARQVTGT